VVNEETQQDLWLDAIAVVGAVHHDDHEAFKAILDANWTCSERLQCLIRGLAILVVLAVEDDPFSDVDEALADARRQTWSSPDLPLARGKLAMHRRAAGWTSGCPPLPDLGHLVGCPPSSEGGGYARTVLPSSGAARP
jgi:hypothetical protein